MARRLAVVLAVLLCSAGVALAAEGDFDPGFNSGNPVVVAAGPSGSATHLNAVAKQADGKVVAVGSTDNGNGIGAGIWVIERYLTDGALDSSFGTGGVVTFDIGNFSRATGVAVQSDQKIVVAGELNSSGTYGVGFVRLNTDGSLDSSFGTAGKAFLSRAGYSVLSSGGVTLDSSGNAYLAAGGEDSTPSFVGMIASVTSTGAPNGWAVGGILVPDTTAVGQRPSFASVAASGGHVFYAGRIFDSSFNSYGLIGAVNASDGSVDSGFGTGGVFRLAQATALNGLLVAADGKLKATGYGVGSGPGTGALIASFTPSGANPTDTSFGSSGQVIVGGAADQPNNGNAITEGNGKLFVASTAITSAGPTQVALVGVDETTGALDTNLGSGGFRAYSFGYQSYATGIVDPSGDLILSGVIEQTQGALDAGALAAVQASAGSTKHYDLTVTITPQPSTLAYDVIAKKFSFESEKWLVTVSNTASADEPSPATKMTVTRRGTGDGINVGDLGASLCSFVGGQTSQFFDCTVPSLGPGATQQYLLTSYISPSQLEYKGAIHSYRGPSVSIPCGAPEESEPQPCPNNSADPSVPVAYAPIAEWGKKGYVEYSHPAGDLLWGFSRAAEQASPKTPRTTGSLAAAVPPGDRVAKVEVAVQKVGSCAWLNARGGFTAAKLDHGRCDRPLWLRAKGTSKWTFVLKGGLARGHYLGYVRAVSRAGASALTFTAKRHNLVPITVK